MRVRWKPASIFGCLTLGLTCLAVPKTANAQTDIPVPNGSFEQPDPASTVKPLGWFRRAFGSFQPTPNVADPVWEYVTNATDALDGTDYVCLHAPPANYGNPVSWDLEGVTAGKVNADNAGQGSLIPVTTGGLYEASVYVRYTGTGTGAARMRLQNQATNDPSAGTVTVGGLYDIMLPTNGWVKLSSGPVIARSNFMSPRLYGNLLTGDTTVCFDKVEFKQLALPVTVTGIVKKANGDPYPGVVVGINEATKNGMADPLGSVLTGVDGRFSITFPKTADSFVAQAWLENNTLSENVPVNLTGDTTITYSPSPLANILIGKPIVAVSSEDPNSPATLSNDGSTGTRWVNRGGTDGDIPEFPHYIVYDLGETVDFATIIKSAEVWWENARAGHWQIRVSDTPPDPAMYTPKNGGNNALALQFGTVVYDSGVSAADFSYNVLNDTGSSTSTWIDVVSKFAPGSGRYVMIAMLAPGPFPNMSIYEFKLLVPATTVTGQVVDSTGAGVGGAVVVELPGRSNFVTADASGNFTLLLPQTGAAHTYFAHALTGDNVYTTGNPFSITPSGATMDIGKVVIGGPAPNEVPVGAATDTYAAVDPSADIVDTQFPPAFAVDHDYTTRWSSTHIPNIDTNVTPTMPIYFVVDMGAAKTINQIIVDWETARPGQYRIQTATTYNMAGRSGGDWTDVKVSTTPPDPDIIYNWGGGDFIDYVRFDPKSARYIRLVLEKRLAPFDNFSIWEIQAANVTAPAIPLGMARQALRIAGGLEAAPADITALNVVTTGTSATVIDILDAITLARQGK